MSFPNHIRGLRFTFALLCTCDLIYPAAVLLPSPGPDIASQRSASVQCTRNVREIILAGNLWAANHNGQLPTTFLDLTNYLSSPALLQCPANHREPAITNWNELTLEHIDYFADPMVDLEFSCVCAVHESAASFDGTRMQGPERPGWPAFMAGAISQFVTPGSDVRLEVLIAPDALRPVHLQWHREDSFLETNVTFVTDPDSPGGGFWRTNRITRFNATPLLNETNTFLVLQNVQTNDSAFYSITARNEMGTALSRRARLAVSTNLFATTNWSEIICLNNLQSISLLAIFWAADHSELHPPNFEVMTNRFGFPIFGWPLVLFCRDDPSRTPPAVWAGFDFQNTSYEFFLPQSKNMNGVFTNVFRNVFTKCRIHPFYADGQGRARSGPLMSPPSFAERSIEFTLYPFFGRTNILEHSSDLSTWTTVETFTNFHEEALFSAPTSERRLFYRLRLSHNQ